MVDLLSTSRLCARCRRGSVLMEFVVVAPLYFVLLGGLFMVADLMVNKMRMHFGDHLVTWVAGSRFCPSQGPNGEDAATFVNGLVKTMFERSIGGAPGDDFHVDREIGSGMKVNSFMALDMGCIDSLPIKMPSWARGMFAMQEVMTGDKVSELAAQNEFRYKCDFFRSFSFHRLALSGIDAGGGAVDGYSRAKNIPIAYTLVSGNLDQILSDRWIGSEEEGGGVTSGGSGANGFSTQRTLVQYGE